MIEFIFFIISGIEEQSLIDIQTGILLENGLTVQLLRFTKKGRGNNKPKTLNPVEIFQPTKPIYLPPPMNYPNPMRQPEKSQSTDVNFYQELSKFRQTIDFQPEIF